MRLLVFALCFIGLPAVAQHNGDFSAFTIDPALLEGAEEVVRYDIGIYRAESPEKGTYTYKGAVTLLNSDSRANRISVGYDDHTKVRYFKVAIYDALGQLVRRVNKDEFEDVSRVGGGTLYTDSRAKLVEATYNKYPYTVVYEYQVTGSGLEMLSHFFHWYFQSFDQGVEQSRYTLAYPESMDFNFQLLNTTIEPTQKVREEGIREYTWQMENLPVIPAEASMPPRSAILPMLMISPVQMEIEGYKGGMKDWLAFSRFIDDLFEGRGDLPESVRADIRAAVKGATTDLEKIDLLYDYLKKNMRYVSVQLGIGGWQPFDANYVSENKYGDCKALTNFMMAMLDEVGIESNPVLIYRGSKEGIELTDEFATTAFNHVLLNVPSENLFLECTSSSYPPGFIGNDNESRKALLIKDGGGQLIDMPQSSAEDNGLISKTTVTLDIEGGATLVTDRCYTGLQHQRMRLRDFYWSDEDMEDYIREEMPLNGASLEDWKLDVAKDEPQADMHLELSVNKFASTAGKRLFVRLNCLNQYDHVPEELEQRHHPIYRKSGFLDRDTVRYVLPDNYKVENVFSEPIEIDSDFGSYRAKVEQINDQELLYTREFRLDSHRLPAETYDDYRSFFKAVRKADRKKVVLVEKKT